jgi:AraC family transcriptional regulator
MGTPSEITAASPDEWARLLSKPAEFSSDPGQWRTAQMRHWRGTAPDMEQPLLDHHYVGRHLGGVKRVERRGEGAPRSAIVAEGSLTVVPAGTAFRWRTRGPIEFAHLYVSPALLNQMASRFDGTHDLTLIDRLGCRDPVLETLFGVMLDELRVLRDNGSLYLDCLLEAFLLKLLMNHSSRKVRQPQVREVLGRAKLQRLLEFIEANLHTPLSLADLTAVAGGSVYHFSRAFGNAMGVSPWQYAQSRRVERAKSLLRTTPLSMQEIAEACGFRNGEALSRAFARTMGMRPTSYRRGRHKGLSM